ncbi:UNVERIFIED_CONTAM: hypothetical protein K2H54_073907 [Gekko kuhli]
MFLSDVRRLLAGLGGGRERRSLQDARRGKRSGAQSAQGGLFAPSPAPSSCPNKGGGPQVTRELGGTGRGSAGTAREAAGPVCGRVGSAVVERERRRLCPQSARKAFTVHVQVPWISLYTPVEMFSCYFQQQTFSLMCC